MSDRDKTFRTPKMGLECLFFLWFKKSVFVKNRVIFGSFWPLVHPIGAVRTEKTQPFPGQKHFGPKKN